MKKITSIALATCMVGSIFAFSGCGNGSVSGAVKGDYKQITAENQEQVVQELDAFEQNFSQVNSGGLMGDTTKPNWSYGVSFEESFNVEYDIAASTRGKVNAKSNLAIAMYKEGTEMAVKGMGSVDFSIKNTTIGTVFDDGDSVTDLKVSAKASAFDGYAYADITMSGKMDNEPIDDSMKAISGKVSYSALGGLLEDYMGDFNFDNIGSSESVVSLGQMVAGLQEMGLPVSYELSEKSGLKLKVSITQAMIEAMLSESASEEISYAMSMETPAVNFKACKLDMYLVISETGLLKQFSADVNINMEIPDGSGKSFVKASGALVVKADSQVKVTVDASKKTDEKYQDYSAFLGMM